MGAIWLLLFQLFAPVAFAASDVTLICSERGVERIQFDVNGNAIPVNDRAEHCDLCTLNHAPDVGVLAKGITLSAQSAPPVQLPLQHSQLIAHRSQPNHSRAPPFSSLRR